MDRLGLQALLTQICRKAYYQTPGNASVKMTYPCVRYVRKPNLDKRADNHLYYSRKCYEMVYITKTVDDPVVERLRELDYCSFTGVYSADELYHYEFTIYI